MTTLARRIASVPVRTSVETWVAICDLLAPAGSNANTELRAVTNAASMLIAEESTFLDAIVVSGSGPMIKLYTVHGEDAIEALAEEATLPASPCASEGWLVSFPCPAADLDDVTAALKGKASFTARPAGATVVKEAIARLAAGGKPVVDLSKLQGS